LNAAGRRQPYPTSRPDLLKHIRALEDALTGVVWRDDSQIIEQHLEKRWGVRAQTTVAVWVKEPE
jgi:Holliday junction resolvase RusA-like endonuclease